MDPSNPYGYPVKMPPRLVRYTFRCMSCEKRYTKDFEKTQTGWTPSNGRGPNWYYVPVWDMLGEHPYHDQKCPACNSPRLYRPVPIEGKANSTPCDSRCTSATGHKCECSCGGKNHGADILV